MHLRTASLKLLALLAAILPPSFSSAEIIDFDSLAAMTFWATTPIADDAKLSTQLLASHGVAFSSGDPYVAVVALGAGHATSGINGIGGSNGSGVLTYDKASPIKISFFDPSHTTTAAETDFVSLRVDLAGEGQTIYLRAYDYLDDLIAETSAVNFGGPTLAISANGIHSVRFFGTTDFGGAAVDDLTFADLTALSIPEPGTLPLLALATIAFFAVSWRSANPKVA
ncbi:MAG: hypothetical protein Q8K96_15940 [Rubrivivax sp.]|nr:hypothetical protein [Rubrivivax sp.]